MKTTDLDTLIGCNGAARKENLFEKFKKMVNRSCDFLTSINPLLFIRIINALFVGGLTFNWWHTLWEHYEYMPTPSDYVWFMQDKVFILLVYLVLLFYVKHTYIKWEVYGCVLFSLIRVAWQIWEIVDRYAANSDLVQLALCLLGSLLSAYLIAYRGIIFIYQKMEKE